MRLILIILLSSQFNSGFSQEKDIKKMIANDMEVLDRAYWDAIFPMKAESPVNYDVCFSIISTTKLTDHSEQNCQTILYKVQIELIEHLIINGSLIIPSDTLTFYVVESYARFYALFGFYETSILSYQDAFGTKAIDCLEKKLVELNILSKKQANQWRNDIQTSSSISSEVGKPCEILKLYENYIPDRFKNTLIIPKLKSL